MIHVITNQKRVFDTEFKLSSIKDAIEYCAELPEICLDTETEGFKCHEGSMLMLQIGDNENQFLIDTTTVDVRIFKELLESKLLVIQNAKFDLQWLYKKRIIPNQIYDTFLAESVLSTGFDFVRKDLGTLVMKYCDVSLDKSIVTLIQKEGLTNRVIRYATDDIKYLGEIKKKQLL